MGKDFVENETLKKMLSSSKIAERKKAVAAIASQKIAELGPDVFELLQNEFKSKKSWDFIVQLIEALGSLHYRNAANELLKICEANEEHDMITDAAAKIYVVLEMADSKDISPAKKLLDFGKFSVIAGATRGLASVKSSPSDSDKSFLIQFINKFEPKREPGFEDVRMGLASCCAGWLEFPPAKNFLEDCTHSEYSPLVKLAKRSLQGKYAA